MTAQLNADYRFRVEILQPGYLYVHYPKIISAEGIAEFYPGYLLSLQAQPQKSCVVGDFSSTIKAPFSAGIEGVKWMSKSQPYIDRVAGFGIHPLLESVVHSILIMAQRSDIRMFKTRAEAEAWAFLDLVK